MLTLDIREKALHAALDGSVSFDIKNLPVGDVMCKYDDGTIWIGERKTSDDFANSIKSSMFLSTLYALIVFLGSIPLRVYHLWCPSKI